MRKLKLQMHISLDGFVATSNSEPLKTKWGDEPRNYSIDNLKNADCLLIGRITAEALIPAWAQIADDPKHADYELGKRITDIPKAVFSNNLKTNKWDNTTILRGNFAEEIKALKGKQGKDIIVYGGVTFVSSLIEEGLIDEYHLLVNPVALGNGMKIFHGPTNLELGKSIPFNCGINILVYKPV
jgi:dihydrofolate reductase